MVRRVFGFYLLRSIYGELRDRSHHIIVYFDLGFLHCLEDTKRYKDKAPGLKIRLIGNCVFRVASFGLWLGILFFVVFVGLGLLGSRKERKREVRCDFAQRLFFLPFCLLHCIPSNESFCRTLRVRSLFLPVLYRIYRVLAFRLWAQRGRLKFLNDHLRIFLCINRGSI